MRYTSNSLVNRIAESYALDDAQKTADFLRLRRLVAKDVIPYSISEDDPREAKTYDEAAAAVLLLVLPLAAMVVEVGSLRRVASTLLSVEMGGRRPIDTLLAAVRDGRRADLVVSLERTGIETPVIVTRVRIGGEAPSADAAAILAAYRATAVETQATMTVNANQRLAPLVED